MRKIIDIFGSSKIQNTNRNKLNKMPFISSAKAIQCALVQAAELNDIDRKRAIGTLAGTFPMPYFSLTLNGKREIFTSESLVVGHYSLTKDTLLRRSYQTALVNFSMISASMKLVDPAEPLTLLRDKKVAFIMATVFMLDTDVEVKKTESVFAYLLTLNFELRWEIPRSIVTYDEGVAVLCVELEDALKCELITERYPEIIKSGPDTALQIGIFYRGLHGRKAVQMLAKYFEMKGQMIQDTFDSFLDRYDFICQGNLSDS